MVVGDAFVEGGNVLFTKDDTKVIKGIAIILMMYHHLFAFPDRIAEQVIYFSMFDLNGNEIAYYIGEFGKICVTLFAFLGGYGTYLSCKNKNITTSIKNKVVNLYVVYWKVFFVFIPICMLFGVARVKKDIATFLWNLSGVNISYNGEWWFFTPYILLLCLYPLINRFLERRNSELFTDLLGVILVNSIIVYVVPEMLEMSVMNSWGTSVLGIAFKKMLDLLPAFMFGCLFAKYDLLSKIKQRSINNFVYWILSFLVIVCVFYARRKIGAEYDFIYAAIFVCASITTLQTPVGKIFYKLFSLIGKESTLIWLIHSFYCYHLCQKIVYMPRYSILIVIWLLLLSFVTSKLIHAIYAGLRSVCEKVNLKVSTYIN